VVFEKGFEDGNRCRPSSAVKRHGVAKRGGNVKWCLACPAYNLLYPLILRKDESCEINSSGPQRGCRNDDISPRGTDLRGMSEGCDIGFERNDSPEYILIQSRDPGLLNRRIIVLVIRVSVIDQL
jgi:hypothetical protein